MLSITNLKEEEQSDGINRRSGCLRIEGKKYCYDCILLNLLGKINPCSGKVNSTGINLSIIIGVCISI